MAKKSLWQPLNSEELEAFAKCWIEELTTTGGRGDYNSSVVWMGFTASLEQQWEFILKAVAHASTDEHLGHVAAGPVEQILAKYGEACISDFEMQSSQDIEFARMLTGAYQHLISDQVWKRVQSIQASVSNPLDID